MPCEIAHQQQFVIAAVQQGVQRFGGGKGDAARDGNGFVRGLAKGGEFVRCGRRGLRGETEQVGRIGVHIGRRVWEVYGG